jgi:hypothetical protein
VIRTLQRFVAMPRDERSRTIEAAVLLFAVRAAFGVLPFPLALRLLGIAQGEAGSGRVAELDANDVSRAIARAAHYVPFRAACLQQAFAALLMLRRRGLAATVRLGVARADAAADLKAHAWSQCGSVPVTGVNAAGDYVPVAAFAA